MIGLQRTQTVVIWVVVFAVIFVFLAMFSPSTSSAREDTHWFIVQQLAADALYLLANDDIAQSKNKVDQIEKELQKRTNLPMNDRQERMVLETLRETQQAYTNVEDKSSLLFPLVRLRLTIDAIHHDEQPLWLHYASNLERTLDELVLYMESRERERYYYLLNELRTHYEVLRPAWAVRYPQWEYERMEAQMLSLIEQASFHWQQPSEGKKAIAEIQETMQLFLETERIEYSKTVMVVTIGISLIILSVLLYVGYRKYHAAKTEHIRTIKHDLSQ